MHRKFSIATLLALTSAFTSLNAATRYVKPSSSGTGDGLSWANASGSLQTTINNATAGDDIWVAAGTYKPTHDPVTGTTSPTDNRDKIFYLKDGVRMYGGFTGSETSVAERKPGNNVTILSGDLDNDNTLANNSYHVLIASAPSSGGTGVTIDGFSITGGYATLNSPIILNGNSINRNLGAGIYVFGGTNYISNNRIYGNQSTSFAGGIHTNSGTMNISGNSIYSNTSSGSSGGGMRCFNGTHTITGNFIYNNTAAATGGGLYAQPGTTSRIDNNVVYGNTAATYGGGIAAPLGTITLSNNTIYANSAATSGGGFSNSDNTITATNNIFWNNTKGGSSTVKGADYGFLTYSTTATRTFNNNLLQLTSISEYNLTGNGGNSITTGSGNKFVTDPAFASATPLGPDGREMTHDDGLRVNCGSPALSAGITGANIPTTDVLGSTRGGTAPTIGAYELPNITTALPTVAKTLTLPQSGVTNYGICADYLIATLESTGTAPVTGNVSAKVWIEPTQPTQFVRRHYELTPATNAATSTGRVTLYFTQGDFDAFNTVAPIDLPTNSGDATGISNLKIEKRSGSSGNGTGNGMPNTYTGSVETINPADNDIVWNSILGRWEVSFFVTGFSGFFVKTQATPLPIRLIAFGAVPMGEANFIKWSTATEDQGTHFLLERSADGVKFETMTKVAGNGAPHAYTEYDTEPLVPVSYYRLKCNSANGEVVYSSTVPVRRDAASQGIRLSPVPAVADVTLDLGTASSSLTGSDAVITDLQGRELRRIWLTVVSQRISLEGLPAGLYILRLADGTALRLIKQ